MEQLLTYFPAIRANTLEDICREYHIQTLSLFGSVLHGDSSSDSDLDLLVKFESGHVPGFSFAQIQEELTTLFGRTVDLHTENSLSKYFRDAIVKEATSVYGKS
ncbi:MAG: nucleotidyltransferase domain-containing protein [bacterium]